MQLFVQLALRLLHPPLPLQELALLHLQPRHLLLAGLVPLLQFCQSEEQCVTLWTGQGAQGCLLWEAGSLAFLCPMRSAEHSVFSYLL